MKKIFALMLSLVMIFSLTTVAFAADKTTFGDISKSAHKEAIEEMYELGVVNGYTQTRFGPDYALSRAQAAQIFVNALYNEDDVKISVILFEDVAANQWYYKAVNTAYYYGIIHGMSATKFAPDDNVSYDQFAAMLLNAMGYDVTKLTGTWPTNVQTVASYLGLYKDMGMIIDSTAAITRAEACRMIYNALHVDTVALKNGKFVSTGKTLYEAMGFEYKTAYPSSKPTFNVSNTDGVIVGPTPSGFNPVVQSGQYWGCVAFVETYTYGNENQYTGFEIVFTGDSTVYRFAGTCITYYFVQSDGTVISDTLNLYDEETGEIGIQRGDELWFEMTFPNSGVYKILSWNDPPYNPDNITLPDDGVIDPDFGV